MFSLGFYVWLPLFSVPFIVSLCVDVCCCPGGLGGVACLVWLLGKRLP